MNIHVMYVHQNVISSILMILLRPNKKAWIDEEVNENSSK